MGGSSNLEIMKSRTRSVIYGGIVLLTFIVAMLAIHGCASRPPTQFEQGIFDIRTNVVPVVEVRTNIVPVTIVQTNVVTVTNVTGVAEFKTNLIPVFLYQTNVVTTTNLSESYLYTPGAGAANVRQVGTEVGNVFGVGGMVGTALGALFSLWGYMRSRKSLVTAANIAQTVETMREFIKSLPNGQQYDNELVNWMTTNQANAGVLQNVITLIQQQVSNRDAQDAAAHIQDIIKGLQSGTLPKA